MEPTDTIDFRMASYYGGGRRIIPPPKNARVSRKDPPPCLMERNDAVEKIRDGGEEGRKLWKDQLFKGLCNKKIQVLDFSTLEEVCNHLSKEASNIELRS